MWRLTGILRSRRVKEWVFFELAVLGATIPVRIPEKLVPDQFEDKRVELSGEITVDKVGKPVLVTKVIVEDTEKS